MAGPLRLLPDPSGSHEPGSVDPPKITLVSLAAVAERAQPLQRTAPSWRTQVQCSGRRRFTDGVLAHVRTPGGPTSPAQPLFRFTRSPPTPCRCPSLTRSNRRGTDPYARWWRRGGTARCPPIPIKRYRENERPERFDRIVQSWDTANKATELSDFSVCTTWGVKVKDLFLLAVFRRRLEYPALKRAVQEQLSLFGANEVLIEDKASGTQLIQELIADGCYGVTRYQPTTDKIMRLHAQTALIENGFVRIPENASWLAEYLHEMTVFPKGKHDDQVDSTAQFLDWVNKPMPSQGIFEFYR